MWYMSCTCTCNHATMHISKNTREGVYYYYIHITYDSSYKLRSPLVHVPHMYSSATVQYSTKEIYIFFFYFIY